MSPRVQLLAGGTTPPPPPAGAPGAQVQVSSPSVAGNISHRVPLTGDGTNCGTSTETLRNRLTGECLIVLQDFTQFAGPTVVQGPPDMTLAPRAKQSFRLSLASNPNCPRGISNVYNYVMTTTDVATGAVL